MHDPMVVVCDIVLPIPVRKWLATRGPRWCVKRMRRSNPENLGEPVYPWWRPAGWETVIAGTRIGLYQLGTIWHNEPRGADSGDICKNFDRLPDGRIGRSLNAWRWHVHHWSIQIHPLQTVRRWLFDRCAECGHRFPFGYSPVTFSWDPQRPPWWKFLEPHGQLLHARCASLRSAQDNSTTDESIIRCLITEISMHDGVAEQETIKRMYRAWEFRGGYRLLSLFGLEWNEARTELVNR